MKWEDKLSLYDQAIAKCPRFERKGKNMVFTSANGHMFSQLNKEGELGIRFSKGKQEQYIQELETSTFTSYGATMQGYVLMPESLWDDLERVAQYLDEGYDFVMSLDPK